MAPSRILLINPNTSRSTSDMMVVIAQCAVPAGVEVTGLTARHGAAMITDPLALAASTAEVVALGATPEADVIGIIVGAFGDPGVARLRALVPLPVIGLAEAGMREAAGRGRRFGVATVTPDLAPAIVAHANALGFGASFTGVQLTDGDPAALAGDPARLEAALAAAVARCIAADGADAVVIGGGPLGAAAEALRARFSVPVISPVAAAARWIVSAK